MERLFIMAENSLEDRWNKVILQNYGSPSIEFVSGVGAELIDTKGNQYLDFLGGIATNVLGHANPEVVAAISNQAATLAHTSNLYAHAPGLALAEKLTQQSGGGKVFFCNSGAEANEAAIKISRLTGKKRIIATLNSFHGRTLGAISLTGQPSKSEHFAPLVPAISHVPFGDTSALKNELSSGDVAMVILEPIQGESGVIIPPSGYLSEVRELTTKYGALLAFDEVQGGMGRTGHWFSHQRENVQADLITLAKGLGGGLPLGALIAVTKQSQLFTPGSHGSTFGGNPISCAAALATLNIIERENLLPRNQIWGEKFKTEFEFPGISNARVAGMWAGIDLDRPKAKEVTKILQERGILVNACSDRTIRIAPPFVITEDQFNRFISTFRSTIQECMQESAGEEL